MISQVYPQCFIWTTYALTTLLEKLWLSQRQRLLDGTQISPYMVELASVLERALNVAHTGNVRVIATSLMNPLFVGRSLVDHGTSTFHECVLMGQTSLDAVHIPDIQFPRNQVLRQPLTASKRSQIFNYGAHHWEVRISHVPHVGYAGMFDMPKMRSFRWCGRAIFYASFICARCAGLPALPAHLSACRPPFLMLTSLPFSLAGILRRHADEVLLGYHTQASVPQPQQVCPSKLGRR